MRAQSALAPGYAEAGNVVLAGNRRLITAMTVSSFLVLPVSCVALGGLASLLRSDVAEYEVTFRTSGEAGVAATVFVVAAALTPLLVLVLHEAVHGVAFWYHTRSRPRFGFTGWYAYATAPGWFFSRNQMVMVSLAPLVAISALGLGTALVTPIPVAVLFLLAVAVNAAGAVGDIYLTLRLLALPRAAVVEDHHDRLTWYLPHPSRP